MESQQRQQQQDLWNHNQNENENSKTKSELVTLIFFQLDFVGFCCSIMDAHLNELQWFIGFSMLNKYYILFLFFWFVFVLSSIKIDIQLFVYYLAVNRSNAFFFSRISIDYSLCMWWSFFLHFHGTTIESIFFAWFELQMWSIVRKIIKICGSEQYTKHTHIQNGWKIKWKKYLLFNTVTQILKSEIA